MTTQQEGSLPSVTQPIEPVRPAPAYPNGAPVPVGYPPVPSALVPQGCWDGNGAYAPGTIPPQGGYVSQPAFPSTIPSDRSTLYIVLSVLEFFLMGIFAIIPLVFSILYKTEYARNPYTPYRKSSTIALISVGVLGVVLVLGVFALVFFEIMFSLM